MINQTSITSKSISICKSDKSLEEVSFELKSFSINVSLHKTISEIGEAWDSVAIQEFFAQSSYLKTIEKDSPDNLKNLYVLLKDKDDSPIAVLLLQSLILELGESFKYENYTTNRSYISTKWQKFRQIVVSRFKFRILTVGNLYLTGQYGFHFSNDKYSKKEQFKIIDTTVHMLKSRLSGTDYAFSGVLYKDYFASESIAKPKIFRLYPFQIDPNMILTLRSSWKTFNDYLLDMRSKYRIRLKNAMKKFSGVERRKMTMDDIVEYNDKMYFLYSQILDGSGFVLAKGEKNYFLTLKHELQDDLVVVGYFIGDRMVGFYTWVLDGTKMDSHFIGVDSQLNLRHQIYLNILLDLVKDAIANRAERLFYYRTALEIKSSVGAEPYDMFCYFRHNNWLINLIIPIAFKYFVPHQNWDQRHPFKV